MMRYTEQLQSSPLKTSGAYKAPSPTPPANSQRITSAQDNRISLTPLWEYVVRTKSLPEGLDLDAFFQAVHERLRNPEREVRQHALRVLTDFVPVIDNAILDSKMQTIMSDLVANLGHIGPAVRKGAIDCLRVYFNYSNNSDNILKDLVYSGLEKAQENKMRTNIVVGIIIALPFFLQKASEESLSYVIRTLFEKMVQIIYQEVTVRALVRIRDLLGDDKFNEFIKFSGSNSTRKDFDLLCEVYSVNGRNGNSGTIDNSPQRNKNNWNDFNQNIIEEGGWKSDTEVMIRENQGEIIEDKVILETEIKLNSGPAITMQIHEESRQSIADVTDSDDDARSSMGIVKVLTDDSEEDYEPRRTPRRVRFGGEIVKLRTPDSDSNQPSDLDNDSTITITPRDGGSDKPLIEIHYTDTKTQRSTSVSRSHIPVPHLKKQKTVRSEPSSPIRNEKGSKKRMMFRSSPNLSGTHVFGEKVPNGSSRIPRRNIAQKDKPVEVHLQKAKSSEVSKEKESSHTTTIQIKFTDLRSKSKSRKRDSKGDKPTAPKPPETPKEPAKAAEEKKVNTPKPSEATEANNKSDPLVTETEIDNKLNQTHTVQTDQIKSDPKPKLTPLKIENTKLDQPKVKNGGEISPITDHQSIEMFHNLTRSPERRNSEPQFPLPNLAKDPAKTSEASESKPPQAKAVSEATQSNHTKVLPKKSDTAYRTSEERNITTADNVLLNREVTKSVRSRNIHTADQLNNSDMNKKEAASAAGNAYNSFHVCSTTISESFHNYVDSPIPTNDNGDCLTCSSSGSENMIFDNSWEDLGVIDRNTINNLNCKDDWRVRLRGLEDVNRILQNPTLVEALEPRAASLLHFLFSSQQHVRLQSAAEDTLKILFSNMKIETIQARLNQIVMNLCKMGSPAGVRLSILLMRRITAEEFLNQLLGSHILGAKSSKIREGALQILMTISRIFPSTEVNVPKATEFVTPLLRDRKKRVRRASLETIAALAQLGPVLVVLETISKASAEFEDKEQLMRVVRTRLSRKQLPAVDLNGCVRYSTPSGESELEWISIGSATTSPQCTGHNPPASSTQDNNFSSAKTESVVAEAETANAAVEATPAVPVTNGQKANYWKSNARHKEGTGDPARHQDENESDWSRNSEENKEDLKNQNLQIWAVDPWTLSTPVKLSPSNGTLRPLFLIQREQFQTNSNSSNSPEDYDSKNANSNSGRKQRRSPRGRSFSPPKRQAEHNSRNEERERFVTVNSDDGYFRSAPSGQLQKSSSSDHIRSNGKTLSGSTSSSNSGASTRNPGWHKNFKSGIPVPVSSDSRLRFRTRHVEASKGPFSIPAQFYRTKSPSPQDTPDRSIISQRAVLVRQPFSSGSESPEFYTPPAEPHLATNFSQPAEDVVLESPRQSESFVEVDTPRYHNENFTVIDDSPPDVLDQNKTFIPVEPECSSPDSAPHVNSDDEAISRKNSFQRQDTVQTEDSFQAQDEFESEEVYHIPIRFEREDTFEEQQTYDTEENFDRGQTLEQAISHSIDDLEAYSTPRTFIEHRSLSKSEVNLQRSPEVSRKSISSAPALNEVLHHIRYERFEETQLSTTQISLPGSVVEFLPEQEVQQVQEETPTKSTPRVPRNVSKPLSRKNSIRSSQREVTPLLDNLQPFPKPKEGYNETLALLDHCDWEMTMKGLQGIRRLTRFHPDITESHIHPVCVALGKHIRNLRSQVARSACLAASEMFTNHKRALEVDLEELAVPLLHRTADTNKFLRSDANAALDKMCLNMAAPRVVSILATKGVGHQNAIVRCAAARLLCSLTNRLGAEKIFQLPKDTRDKILLSGANMLMEGNLETRKHAKMMFGNLARHSQFNRAMMEAVPVCTMRHIQKTLKSLQ